MRQCARKHQEPRLTSALNRASMKRNRPREVMRATTVQRSAGPPSTSRSVDTKEGSRQKRRYHGEDRAYAGRENLRAYGAQSEGYRCARKAHYHSGPKSQRSIEKARCNVKKKPVQNSQTKDSDYQYLRLAHSSQRKPRWRSQVIVRKRRHTSLVSQLTRNKESRRLLADGWEQVQAVNISRPQCHIRLQSLTATPSGTEKKCRHRLLGPPPPHGRRPAGHQV